MFVLLGRMNPATLLMDSELFCISHCVALAGKDEVLKNGQCRE